MKTNPGERRERLLTVVDDGHRLAEFASDPIVQAFFDKKRRGLLAEISDHSIAFEALRDSVAMIRALGGLEQMLKLSADAGKRAATTLSAERLYE